MAILKVKNILGRLCAKRDLEASEKRPLTADEDETKSV